MSRAGGKSAELDRRASLRQSARLSVNPGEGHDVYEEDYDLAALAISDGFRPSDVAQNHAPPSNYLADGPAAYRSTPPPRPSSIAKPPRGQDSFALRHDGATGSNTDAVPTRASSTSTNSPFITPETPYQGPTGPSHPYQMYPQNTRLARTASLATTSTAPVSERSYNGPSGPTHPYGMYPQNTVPEAEDDTPSPQAAQAIAVGFPGAVDQYQRRIGAEGEDVADMIGPDGHTEQLPPYTRYPDEAYNRKVQGIETPRPAATASSPLHAVPGAGGLGLATRNPEFSSRDDLGVADSPHSRQSLRSFTSEASQHDINTAARTVANEKPQRGWKKTARKKMWGVVPVWAICLAALVLLVMCIILASVLGTVLSHKKPPKDKNRDDPEPVSMTFDAVPLSAVPTDLPALPLGVFNMPLLTSRAPATCFNDTTQAQAWTCNIVYSQTSMIVNPSPDKPATSAYTVSIVSNSSYLTESFVYSYGMQPPKIKDVELALYNDTFELSRGPAWAFQIVYNKTIIIPENFLAATPTTSAATSTGTPSQKRGFPPPGGPADFKRKGVAQTGEKPWICHWDGTFLEAFIYASQNSSIYRSPSSTMTFPFSTTATSTASPDPSMPGGPFPFPTNMPPPPPPYPKVMKMEERRAADAPAVQPWCRQYEIMGDGVPARPYKPDGINFADVFIVEDEPSFQKMKKKKKNRDGNGDGNKRRTVPRSLIENYLNERDSSANVDMSDCGCMWWLT